MTPFRKGRRAGDRGAGGMGDPPGWRGAVGGASLEGWGPVLSVGEPRGNWSRGRGARAGTLGSAVWGGVPGCHSYLRVKAFSGGGAPSLSPYCRPPRQPARPPIPGATGGFSALRPANFLRGAAGSPAPTPTRRRVPGAQHRLLPLLPPVGSRGGGTRPRGCLSPLPPPPTPLRRLNRSVQTPKSGKPRRREAQWTRDSGNAIDNSPCPHPTSTLCLSAHHPCTEGLELVESPRSNSWPQGGLGLTLDPPSLTCGASVSPSAQERGLLHHASIPFPRDWISIRAHRSPLGLSLCFGINGASQGLSGGQPPGKVSLSASERGVWAPTSLPLHRGSQLAPESEERMAGVQFSCSR